MKKIILSIALAFVGCAPAHAYTAQQIETCRGYGEAAYSIYHGAANGVPMSDNMNLVRLHGAPPIYSEIVRAAYQRPLMSTPDGIHQEGSRFRNEIEAMCFEAFAN